MTIISSFEDLSKVAIMYDLFITGGDYFRPFVDEEAYIIHRDDVRISWVDTVDLTEEVAS